MVVPSIFGAGDVAKFDRNKVIHHQIAPAAWTTGSDTRFTRIDDGGGSVFNDSGFGITGVYAPLQLPNNAEILSAVVYGDFVDGWSIVKSNVSTGVVTSLGGANLGTTKTYTGSEKQVINNAEFTYFVKVESIPDQAKIYGCTIIYTVQIDFADQQERV